MKRILIALARVVAGLCIQLGGMYLAVLISFDLDGSGPDWLWLVGLGFLGLAGMVAGWIAGRYLMVPALILFVLVWTELCEYDQLVYMTPSEALDAYLGDMIFMALCCAVLAGGIALGYRDARRTWPGLSARAPGRVGTGSA